MSCSYCVGTYLGHCPRGSAHQQPISGTWSPIEQQSSIPGISSRLSGIRSKETLSSRESLFWSIFLVSRSWLSPDWNVIVASARRLCFSFCAFVPMYDCQQPYTKTNMHVCIKKGILVRIWIQQERFFNTGRQGTSLFQTLETISQGYKNFSLSHPHYPYQMVQHALDLRILLNATKNSELM